MKIDIKDVTIIIPIRIDSLIRLENLLLTVDNIVDYFDTNIVIIESGKYRNGIIEALLANKVSYVFIEDYDPIFYRTKYINDLARQVNTAIIGVWDADIILEAEQIYYSVMQIRKELFDVAYPYNGLFYDISDILRNYYIKTKSIDLLKDNVSKMDLIYCKENRYDAVGGAFLISKFHYIKVGFENEIFYGWGSEDGERITRFQKMDLKIYRSAGPLFHLTHPRDINGGIDLPPYYVMRNSNAGKYLVHTTREEIEQHIATNLLNI